MPRRIGLKFTSIQGKVAQLDHPHLRGQSKHVHEQIFERLEVVLAEITDRAEVRTLAAGKHLVDTIKMIAYRAETTLVQIAREQMSRTDDGRQLIASLFQTTADLHPAESEGTLTVRLHHSANHAHDEVTRHLCAELNATAADFPGTNLRLVYELGTK